MWPQVTTIWSPDLDVTSPWRHSSTCSRTDMCCGRINCPLSWIHCHRRRECSKQPPLLLNRETTLTLPEGNLKLLQSASATNSISTRLLCQPWYHRRGNERLKRVQTTNFHLTSIERLGLRSVTIHTDYQPYSTLPSSMRVGSTGRRRVPLSSIRLSLYNRHHLVLMMMPTSVVFGRRQLDNVTFKSCSQRSHLPRRMRRNIIIDLAYASLEWARITRVSRWRSF